MIGNSNKFMKVDIIQSVLDSDFDALCKGLQEYPNWVNKTHKPSGMNLPMLAAHGRMPAFVKQILVYADKLNFDHLDNNGRDLLDHGALSCAEAIMIDITDAYEKFDSAKVNTWPEPE